MIRILIIALTLSLSVSPLFAESKRLTNDNLFKRDPRFIKDGKEIVYVVLSRPEQLQIRVLNLTTRSTAPLHKDERRSELEPTFSRDDRYYAHLQSRSPASVAMMIHDTKENSQVEIPPASGFSGMRSPTFSADGQRVLYSFSEGGRQKIFSCNLKAQDRKTIVDSIGINNWPTCSDDGKRLVFGSTRDGNFEIYASDIDGDNIQRLTETPAQDIRPRVSPDGRRVAFCSNRDGNHEIYIMNIDGSDIRRLTNHPERDDYPAWHSNGKQLVVVSERAGRHDLYLIDVK